MKLSVDQKRRALAAIENLQTSLNHLCWPFANTPVDEATDYFNFKDPWLDFKENFLEMQGVMASLNQHQRLRVKADKDPDLEPAKTALREAQEHQRNVDRYPVGTLINHEEQI